MWNIMKKYECMAIGCAPAGVSYFFYIIRIYSELTKSTQTGTRTPSKRMHDRCRCGDG